MSGPPAFQFYPGDFDTSTKFLSVAATGAHIRMMCASWEHGPIADTPAALQKAMGLAISDPPFEVIWQELKPRWLQTKNGWIHRRLEKTRRDQDDYRRKMQKAGRKSAKLRSEKSNQAATTLQPSSQLGSDIEGNQEATLRSSYSDLRSSVSTLPSPVKGKDPAADAAPTNALLALFTELHVERFQTKPHIRGGKDAKLLAELWKSRDRNIDEIDRLMRVFFASKDEFIIRAGFTVGVFVSQFGKLLSGSTPRPRTLGPVYSYWHDECKAVHDGQCKDNWNHSQRILDEKAASA